MKIPSFMKDPGIMMFYVTSIGAGLGAGGLFIALNHFTGCTQVSPSLEKTVAEKVYTVSVTQGIDVEPDVGGIGNIRYMGMPNEKTFSLAPDWAYASVNAFYPVDAKEILCSPYRFEVMDISPDHVTLKYLGKNTKEGN